MYRNTLLQASQTLRYIRFPVAFFLIRFRVVAAEFRLKFTLKSLLPCNSPTNHADLSKWHASCNPSPCFINVVPTEMR